MQNNPETPRPPTGEDLPSVLHRSEQPAGGLGASERPTMKNITNSITAAESIRLKKHEKEIKKGLGTVYKVAEALTDIRENKLYRKNYGTFEEYCEKKWGITRRRAYQMIEAGETAKSLPPEMGNNFTNSAQLNALAKVPKEQRQAVAETIIQQVKSKGGKVTAASIEQAAATILHTEQPAQPSALKGVDTAKLNQPEPEPDREPIKAPPVPPVPPAPEPKPTTMTLPAFRKEIERLKAQADAACNGDQKQRDLYGTIANDLARHLLNPVQVEYNPYGR